MLVAACVPAGAAVLLELQAATSAKTVTMLPARMAS
jgi:hypothetical protein